MWMMISFPSRFIILGVTVSFFIVDQIYLYKSGWSPKSRLHPQNHVSNTTQFSSPNTTISDEEKTPAKVVHDVCNSDQMGVNTSYDAISLWSSNGKTHVAVVSVHTGTFEDDVYKRALETHKHYAQHHNYPFYDLREDWIQPPVWNKLLSLLSIMLEEIKKPKAERLDWLFWFDSDSIILNYCIPLQIYVPTKSPSTHVLVAEDENGINIGTFMIRVSTWSIELLSTILGFRYIKPDVHLPTAEQSAMGIVADLPNFKGGMVTVPNRWFNSYRWSSGQKDFYVQEGDLLLHFPGQNPKPEFMRPWLAITEHGADGWVMDWRAGPLATQIVEFWEKFEANGDVMEEDEENQEEEEEKKDEEDEEGCP